MCLNVFFPMNHHQNVIQFLKIQKNIIQIKVYFKNQLNFFQFRQISIKYEILKLTFVQCSESSMG